MVPPSGIQQIRGKQEDKVYTWPHLLSSELIAVLVVTAVTTILSCLLFGYFDPGSPLFPSYVVFGIILALFVLHVALLAHDEKREHRERNTPATPTEQPTPAPATTP